MRLDKEKNVLRERPVKETGRLERPREPPGYDESLASDK